MTGERSIVAACTAAALAWVPVATGAQEAQEAQEAPAAQAQEPPAEQAQEAPAEAPAEEAQAQEAPESLKIYFDTGSANITADQDATLDQAARLFRDGNPIVMIAAGVADTVGSPDLNLVLSVARAEAVARGLSDRGIPVGRLQVLGRGNSELEVDTEDEVAEAENRIAEITWR